MRALGGLDVLINNAGGLVKRVPVAEIGDAIFDEIVDLNVRSLVIGYAAGVPHLRKAGGGSIINVTSIAARHGGGPGAALYASAKGFVSTFTRGIARELAPERIRVNAVSPGVITDALPRALLDAADARGDARHDPDGAPRQCRGVRRHVPLPRLRRARRLRDRAGGRGERRTADAVTGGDARPSAATLAKGRCFSIQFKVFA